MINLKDKIFIYWILSLALIIILNPQIEYYFNIVISDIAIIFISIVILGYVYSKKNKK